MALLAIAAVIDARTQRLPNVLIFLLLILFPAFYWSHEATTPLLDHLEAFGLVLVAGFALYARKWVGAGDIKLLAVLALWAGLDLTPLLLGITLLTGGILCLGVAATTMLRQIRKKNLDVEVLRKTPVAYGVAIATGGLCVLLRLSHNSFFLG
jgi:prepilin peptidase CpaA